MQTKINTILVIVLLLFSVTAIAPSINYSEFANKSYYQLSKEDQKQIDCLADNIYREAAGESKDGHIAVAAVTMNRTLSGKFPSTICEVVYQKTGKTYQFSWVGMKNRLHTINEKVYNEIRQLATATYLTYNRTMDNTGGAIFYHAKYVRPKWKKVIITAQIGQHIFYRNV